MQVRHASGDDWWGGPASQRRDLLAIIAQPRTPTSVPDDRIGQVAQVVEWNSAARTAWIVFSGNTEKLPVAGNLIFGRRLAGRIIERRVEAGVIRGDGGGEPGRMVLRVSSEYCPPEGARIRLG